VRAWMSWSSGKDSALALHRARHDPALDVVGLLCTVNADADRVAMHAVRRELLLAQADRLGLPVHVVELPWPCPNTEYERLMTEAVDAAAADGVTRMIFGDLFLADIRAYREERLRSVGREALFPLWGRDTAALAETFVAAGFEATICCLDPAQLDPSFAGRRYDASLLAELPAGIDPCGENGEFHTFVHGGPIFAAPIQVEVGETVERDGFVFTDLCIIPSASSV